MPRNALAQASDTPALNAHSYPGPLAAILAEHDNLYEVCRRLENLAEDLGVEPMATEAVALKAQLTVDLPRHETLEEQHLFPLLRRRCKPKDGIRDIIARLYSEHALDETLVEYIIDDLGLVAGGFNLANPLRLRLNIKSFVANQRRHIAWENDVVLPLAERRLMPEDLVDLGYCLAVQSRISSLAG